MEFASEDDFIAFDNEFAENSETCTQTESSAVEIPINGIKVKFPFKPYPSQIGMMDKVIRSLNSESGQHALLESPTGSGKTMALLCGVLAWVEDMRAKNAIPRDPRLKTLNDPSNNDGPEDELLKNDSHEFFAQRKPARKVFVIDDDMDEDFTQSKGAAKACDDCGKGGKEASSSENRMTSIPKIYFCSRTHKQLAQSIRELKRSTYDARFTVLASRNHYCINTHVRKMPDLNEECKNKMLSTKERCMYSNKLQKFVDSHEPFTTNMDVEELVNYGKKTRLCPFFLSREAAVNAEIIMCPYNYIIEPSIRQAMNIELKDAIIVIDEAHNIEDTCRAAGSFEWGQEQVFNISNELKSFKARMHKGEAMILQPAAHDKILDLVTSAMAWLNNDISPNSITNSVRSFDTKIDIFEGSGLMDQIISLGLTAQRVEEFKQALVSIEEASRKMVIQNMADEHAKKPKSESDIVDVCLSSTSCRLVGGFLFVLDSIYSEGGRNLSAFRLVKYEQMKFDKHGRKPEMIMGFWCLSSEVVFREIATKAKSIILTSGTLSPMDTFASELRTNFPNKLEASHVIKPDQIFVGAFPRGPNGVELLGNYQNVNSFNFQDDVSQAILDICKVTPFGILCFLPSYALLEKLLDRMQSTALYRKIQQYKEIVVEPRAGSNEDFETLIKHYYRLIAECKRSHHNYVPVSDHSERCVTGAIFFAVYRGKVSEGLDFADENARAVINIGIPYPAIKDPKVNLKKEYNDRHKDSLLPGHLWYDTQAFRAMNQALGRCIRHRNDWGAVIFLEQRFNIDRNVQKLSKWVRPSVRNFPVYVDGLQQLREFMKEKGSKLPEEIVPEQQTVIDLTETKLAKPLATSAFFKRASEVESTANGVATFPKNRHFFQNGSNSGSGQKTLGMRLKRPKND